MEKSQPNYLKRIYTVLIIIFVISLIYFANQILFPLIIAFIFAILIRPVDGFLQNRLKFPRAISILLTVLMALTVLASIFFLLGIQLKEFIGDLPKIEKNMTSLLKELETWIDQQFGISSGAQEQMVKENLKKSNILTLKSFGSVTSSLVYIILIPIYMFLMLFYRVHLISFLLKLVSGTEEKKMENVISDIKVIIRQYILGLLLEVAVVATLTSVGYWLIGVPYALFLGLLTALFNLIPFVGILVANVISCLLALSASPNIEVVFGVLGVAAIVQFIDNNILMPRIVGSKVRINALASILSVIVGGTLAGVPGMFLAIPVTAMVKVVFDALPQFQPYGYLLGDETPKERLLWPKRKTPKKGTV